MNLNSFIGLMGHSLKRVETSDGVILRDVRKDESPDFVMRDSEYVLTLDADSMLLRDYCLRLVYQMEHRKNRSEKAFIEMLKGTRDEIMTPAKL